MKYRSKLSVAVKALASIIVISSLVVACGGGGGGSSTSGGADMLGGVAASGAPVVNGAGYALDAATGAMVPFTTNSGGSYSVNLAGYSGPFLLHVVGLTSGGSPANMYSLASASNFGKTINVTPLSDVVLAYAAGVTTQSLETACTGDLAACPALLNGILANLSSANTAVISSIPANVLAQYGLNASTLNAITTQFTATHTGVDGLLDALAVVPAAATGPGSYTISLVGATPTTLATVPTSGTAGTESTTAPATVTTPTSAALLQAQNLAAIQSEVQTFWQNFGNLFATSLPTSSQLTPYIDANFLLQGMNGATFIAQTVAGNTVQIGQFGSGAISVGGLAPYSGAPLGTATTPGSSLTYDANNCVVSMWVTFSNGGSTRNFLMNDAIPGANSPGVCTGGTWTLAGDQRTYYSDLVGIFQKWTNGISGTPTYSANFQFDTSTNQTPGNPTASVPTYDTVAITGPGLATVGNPTATTGTVILAAATSPPTAPSVLQQQNSINDPFYGTAILGSSLLADCTTLSVGTVGNYGVAATSSTPCFNPAATLAGSDYTIQLYTGGTSGTLLETDMQRIYVTISAVSVPASWYPTITSITPSSAASIPTGATVTPVTVHWTLAPGALTDSQADRLYDSSGNLIFQQEDNLSPTATSHTINVTGLTSAPASGYSNVGVLTPIGGLKVGTGTSF